MDHPIVTQPLLLTHALHEPDDAEVESAGAVLGQLEAEAKALGRDVAAAKVHAAMGRIWIERLGDPKSAATCFQNAFELDPTYRPNLEAARRLFAGEMAWDKALALHRCEEALLRDPLARAESMRAQAKLLGRDLAQPAEAAALIEKALELVPDHPALLQAAIDSAERRRDRRGVLQALLRAASSLKDDVQRAVLLRRAQLLLEQLWVEAEAAADGGADGAPLQEAPFSIAELQVQLQDVTRRLHQASSGDPIALLALIQDARTRGDWEALFITLRRRAEKSGVLSEVQVAALVAARKLGRDAEAIELLQSALGESSPPAIIAALQLELAPQGEPAEKVKRLLDRAQAATEPSERVDLRIRASELAELPAEKDALLRTALAEAPQETGLAALRVRSLAERDPRALADELLGEAALLEATDAAQAAVLVARAGTLRERAKDWPGAAELALRAHGLAPEEPSAIRLLQRALLRTGAHEELVRRLEASAGAVGGVRAAELLSRAAALLFGLAGEEPAKSSEGTARARELARRAAELGRRAQGPRWADGWTLMALRARDESMLRFALELRAEAASGGEGAELWLEVAESLAAEGDDVAALGRLVKARVLAPESPSVRAAFESAPGLRLDERLDLLAQEAASAPKDRAGALCAERAAMLAGADRLDEASAALRAALAVGGPDALRLRWLARIELARKEFAGAIETLLRLATCLPEGPRRAEIYWRAAELAEWELGDAPRALQLLGLVLQSSPTDLLALAARARLLAWEGKWPEAALAAEECAAGSKGEQRAEALRWAASLRAFRTREPELAAAHLRTLMAEEPGDLDAPASLLDILQREGSYEGRRERVELRARLASRCQDPRFAAFLRAQSAEDRLALGDTDQGIAEYRRSLALNPHDRVALDVVEEALRRSNQRQLLVDHLAFRCAYEDPISRAALALQQAELLAEDGQLERAAGAYRQALSSDPTSLIAVRGARTIAEKLGERAEAARLLSKEAGLTHDPAQATLVRIQAARLAEELGDHEEAVHLLTAVIEHDPRDPAVIESLRRLHPEQPVESLIGLFERVGGIHADPRAAAFAWTFVGKLQLHEQQNAQAAFMAAGRALARQPDDADALALRAEAAEAAGRFPEAVEALSRQLSATPEGAAALALRLRIGCVYLERLGDGERALPLLLPQLDRLEVPTLALLAQHARRLLPADSARLHRRLIEAWPTPPDADEPGLPTRGQIAAWNDELGRACLALGQRGEALVAFRRAVELDEGNRAALARVAELAADSAPAEALAAWQRLFRSGARQDEPVRAMLPLFRRLGRPDGAFCAAATLVSLGTATPEERALYDEVVKQPPPAEIPALPEVGSLVAPDDSGPARALLAAAATELARAFPTELAGRGERVKADNPVRRICAALARSLLQPEPAIYLSRSEPGVVSPVAADAPGILVGAEAPRLYPPRAQRFLYTRSLAHLRRGTHPFAGWSADRLGRLVAAIARLCSPAGTDLRHLPAPGEASTDADVRAIERALDSAARQRLAPLARQLHAAPVDFAQLALGLRATAERTALVLCGDPAAGLQIVAQECPGGLERPEVASLAAFAVGEEYLALRAR
jgi:tetratricopeptide (TPR) repeat protein